MPTGSFRYTVPAGTHLSVGTRSLIIPCVTPATQSLMSFAPLTASRAVAWGAGTCELITKQTATRALLTSNYCSA